MGTTAYDEQLGGSLRIPLPAGTIANARLPSGPNGVRLYVLVPEGPLPILGIGFRLPNPAYCSVGAEPVVTLVHAGSGSPSPIEIFSYSGVSLGFLQYGYAIEIWLPATTADAWILGVPRLLRGGMIFSGLAGNRKPFDIVYTASSVSRTNVRRDIAKQYGYVGADGPVAISVLIKTGVVLGGSLPSSPPSFETGSWPSGSTMKITLEPGAYIAGGGGAGGVGMSSNSTGGSAGSVGGDAMLVQLPTVLFNYGTIQGGGGGGGGGAARIVNGVATQGGSGGGGAGAPVGLFGPIVQGNALTFGQPGQFLTGGTGGGIAGGAFGGTGGLPGFAGANGQSGTTAGQLGGAAGAAFRVNTSAGASLTKAVLGTVWGAEINF